MKKRGRMAKMLAILICGLILGVIVFKITLNNTTDVLVAVQDIPSGTQLTSSMFQVKKVHQDGVEPDALHSSDSMLDKSGAMKAIAVTKILSGSQLSQTNVSLPTSENSIASKIAKGDAGMLLPINQINGLSNSLNMNDTVALLATVDTTVDDENGRRVVPQTIVLGENIRIIGIEKDDKGVVIGYIVDVKGQTAEDIHHILATQDKDNKSAIRVIVTGIGDNKTELPKAPLGDIVSRYLKQ